MNRYIIVDCAARSDAAQTLRFYAEGFAHRSLFQGLPEAQHADAGPWLVQVDESMGLEGWLNALEGTGKCAPCVTHLASSLGFEAVFSHLQSFLDVQLPDSASALLRYWDPRVFHRLQRVLSQDQIQSLIAPFAEWRTSYRR